MEMLLEAFLQESRVIPGAIGGKNSENSMYENLGQLELGSDGVLKNFLEQTLKIFFSEFREKSLDEFIEEFLGEFLEESLRVYQKKSPKESCGTVVYESL